MCVFARASRCLAPSKGFLGEFGMMEKKQSQPTAKGEEIPIPKGGDFFKNLSQLFSYA
jgi:hypothetical protein